MNNKICPACSAVNEPNFLFCNKCGKSLENPPEFQAPVQNQQNSGYEYNQNQQYAQGYGPGAAPNGPGVYGPGAYNPGGMIDNITAEEAAAYVGPKASHYLPKFQEMSATGSKTNFNIMLFILSFFVCGPIAVGFWLISKKVYKQGIIIASVFTAASLAILLMLIPLMNSIMVPVSDAIEYANSQTDGDYTSPYFQEYITEYLDSEGISNETMVNLMSSSIALMMVSGIYSIISLVFSILLPLKANYWYKNHVVQKVNEARSTGRASLAELSMMGGTTAIWGAFLAGYLILTFIATSVVLSGFFDVVFKMISYTSM